MNILWFSWKDISHPQAGGAEVILHQLSKRLAAAGHNVTILTARYNNSSMHDTVDGVKIIRVGSNRYFHSFIALGYYLKNLRSKYDIVIEAVNTAPYFSCFFKGKAKSFLFYHQLAREIWFHEAPAPLSHIGYYLLEPVATFLMSRAHTRTITVSNSTKNDLKKYGFRDDSIQLISEGIELTPLKDSAAKKYERPTMLSLGSGRAMKRTLDQIVAFEIAKRQLPDLQLKIAGDMQNSYGKRVQEAIARSPYKQDIEVLGWVSLEQKNDLMQKSHCITVTSIKEGWGLIVTEAASQGTPAVVYNVDGLRDSVQHAKTGIVTEVNPQALATGIVSLLQNKQEYERMQIAAWQWSKKITFEQSYKDFTKIIGVSHV